jgi:hypothetical protein
MKNVVEISKNSVGAYRIHFLVSHKFAGDEKETLVFSKVKTIPTAKSKSMNREQVQKLAEAFVDKSVAQMQEKLGT